MNLNKPKFCMSSLLTEVSHHEPWLQWEVHNTVIWEFQLLLELIGMIINDFPLNIFGTEKKQ